MTRFHLLVAAPALALSLGACASMPQPVQDAVRGVALGGPSTAQDRVHSAIDLLHRGDEQRARSQLEAALRQEPGNASARRLLAEIDTDPRTQLGPRTRAYVVRDSDTMTSLAERFAGDPLLFYALARLNHVVPNDLRAGQTIQVPDRSRPSAVSARPPPGPTVTPAAPTAPAAVASAPPENAQRASRLRLQGLERLNAGDVDHAVTLLSQAHALDAGNSVIQSDLNRAQRIQATLHAR